MKQRLALLAAALLTALALTVGGLTAPQRARAESVGLDASACSYAQNSCHFVFYNQGAAGNVTMTLYTTRYGYTGYKQASAYACDGCQMDMYIFVHDNERVDDGRVDLPGTTPWINVYVAW